MHLMSFTCFCSFGDSASVRCMPLHVTMVFSLPIFLKISLFIAELLNWTLIVPGLAIPVFNAPSRYAVLISPSSFTPSISKRQRLSSSSSLSYFFSSFPSSLSFTAHPWYHLTFVQILYGILNGRFHGCNRLVIYVFVCVQGLFRVFD